MYIPYERIGSVLKQFCPIFSDKIEKFFYKKKMEQNCTYIKKNLKKVLLKLKKRKNKKPLRVLFHVYDHCKWKSQAIYDLMANDDLFEPIIVVSKNAALPNNPNYQTKDDVVLTYNFFKNQNMNVKYGYDIEKETFIPFEIFKPDIIFYTHPYFVQTQQGPVVCSKFALTYYIPYFVANTNSWVDFDLRFHHYIHKHYVLNEEIKLEYENRQNQKSNNFVATGHPILDFYKKNNHKESKNYVIYAPHWTVFYKEQYFSTFHWSGELILDFAKQHPEINWAFKPHPLLIQQAVRSNFMTVEEIKKYYKEWESIASCSYEGNYAELFNNASAMITDSASFLTEFFVTENPVIHLVSNTALEYNNNVKKIVDSYYQAHDKEELEKYLKELILEKKDYKKEKRITLLNELNLKNQNAAKNIINDIKKELNL